MSHAQSNNTKPLPDSYLIMISEPQRAVLLKVIKEANKAYTGEGQALEYWEGMLEDLVDTEQNDPGIFHGFCL